MHITLTAGHSQTDPGAVNGTDREADIAQTMRNIVTYILRHDYGLEVKTDGEGKKWPQSRRAAGGGKTLQDSGQLAASITTKSGNGYARIGSNKVYAAIHHFGGTVKAKNKPYLMIPVGDGFRKVKQVQIPARPYLPLNADGQLQPGGENKLLQVALDALSKGV